MATMSPTRFSPRRMKQARLAAGMTQSQLARAISKSELNVGRWERGQHEPRGESVAAIAAATGKEIGFFYSEEGSSDDDDEEADPVSELRRIAGELTVRGEDDLATDLLRVVHDVAVAHEKQEPTAALFGADGDRLETKGA